MPIAYLDCQCGIREDALLAALLDAGVDRSAVQRGTSHFGLSGLTTDTVQRSGWRDLRIAWTTASELPHLEPWPALLTHLSGLPIDPTAREIAVRVLSRQAGAEAHVRALPLESISVQQLGGIDAVAAVVGCAIGLTELAVETVYGSPVGVECNQSASPSPPSFCPPPATAELLRGAPLEIHSHEGMSTTSAGAALVNALCVEFGTLPNMTPTSIGYGSSHCTPQGSLRVIVGNRTGSPSHRDDVIVLETNLDNCSPEFIGYAIERLFAAGAWDCFSMPIQMKKSRPATQLSVIAPSHLQTVLEGILFQETPTLGVRVQHISRTTLPRREQVWESPWGPIRIKVATLPSGAKRGSPEFEDCRRIALATGKPLMEIDAAARQAISIGGSSVGEHAP